ncbi:hypothetical protein F0562_014173 [Nyssa sinensis]|uniref:Receptor-like serine/threonine-protein kinase n=1 Tax=Nyssa sinensis TaxID=561372 RepID=A0A5J4ZRX7_9ASTE|nr:hypothetical protein F0562_014173 [Nyssa sinensis]
MDNNPQHSIPQRATQVMGLLTWANVTSLFQALILLSCFCLQACTAIDTITLAQPIKDPDTIISDGEAFKLGFFSPVNTSNRYLGTWYNNVPVMTVVWVANRDKPLNDSIGTVAISQDGNLVLLDRQKEIIWSSNASNSMVNSSAQLLDTGDLVLRDDSNQRKIWESFQDPSDSFLKSMRISKNVNTGEKIRMTSWKSPSDPSVGSFSAGIGDLNLPEIFIWNGSNPYWRSGPWNGQKFIGIPGMNSIYPHGFTVEDDGEGAVCMSFSYVNKSSIAYFVLNSEGTILLKYWSDGMEDWEISWSVPDTECDVYGKCGPFGSCNPQDSPKCTCLEGFEPNNIEEWNNGNFTSGCVRRRPLQCERSSNSSEVGKEDWFLKLEMMKVPDFAELGNINLEDECESRCFKNCSCVASAYYNGIGCMLWTGNLIDVQKFSTDGADLYIRLAYKELDKKQNMKVIIAVAVTVGSLTVAICTVYLRRWIAKHRDSQAEGKKKGKMLSKGGESFNERMPWDSMDQVKLEELPLFNFKKLAIATNNFHLGNKLGQGGFGLVYKARTAIDTITLAQPIKDPGTFISKGEAFQLGFFSPVNTSNRYVGIWYNNVSVMAVVWVANRDRPLNDSSRTLAISKDGNLVVLDGQEEIIWSSNVSNSVSNSSAQLLDSGDLALLDNSNRSIIWDSFQHPSDSFPKRISNNANTDQLYRVVFRIK